jgi:hypothetical protein
MDIYTISFALGFIIWKESEGMFEIRDTFVGLPAVDVPLQGGSCLSTDFMPFSPDTTHKK